MASQPLRIAINGFGRIGRLVFRMAFADPDFEIVALNDLGEPDNLAYLLKYDSVYGRYATPFAFEKGEWKIGNAVARAKININNKSVLFFQEKDPAQLPWKDLQIDVAVESTGAFESFEKAQVHLTAGAKRVVLTAPAKDEDGPIGKTVLVGANESEMKSCSVTSNGSCTTNAAHPVIQILHEAIGVQKAILSTVHGYTATQNLVDGPTKGSDFRRGRAGAFNIVPSTTGAATAVTRAIKDLAGKFDGLAFRVPVVSGSLADITMVTNRKTTVEEVNAALEKAAQDPRWNKTFAATREQLVSSDIVGMPYGGIADLNFTKVIDGDLVKVVSWYDNEMGYTQTLLEHMRKIKQLP